MRIALPPVRLFVGAGILLVFSSVYFQFAPHRPDDTDPTNQPPSPSWGLSISVPPLANVTAESDRDQYYLGENPTIRLILENRGRLPFQISTGGDNRGGTRPARLRITVRDSSGRILPDPMPIQRNMGGRGYMPVIQTGDRHTLEASLLRYALIEEPGLYTIEISHDFGWRPTATRPIPIARLQLRFNEPDAGEAQAIVARAGTPHRLPAGGPHSDSLGDYTSLRHPIYLPLLKTKADDGTAMAVVGIGHIKGSPATTALLDLATHPASTADIRLAAVEMLAGRAPYPPEIYHFAPRLVITPEHLRDGAWNHSLRARTLRLAREILSAESANSSELVTAALDLLSAFGGSEDSP